VKPNRWAVAGLVVIVAVGAAWFVRTRAKKSEPRYRTAAVERGDLTASVSATGTVKPVVQVEVGSQVSGTLEKLYADYNSRVRAGQVLCTLEPSAFRARLAQSEAAVARAEAALKDANRKLVRSRELVKDDYISQADVEAAEVEVEQRRADVKQAQAQLQSSQVDLDHATIRAPIDGVVISRSIDVGQTVAASLQAPKLFVIANDLTQMQVETRIDEADIGRVRSGLPVSFTVDAFPDQEFEGSVSQVRLEPITDQNVVTYTTVIATRNEQLQLRPGMTANVVVSVETRRDVLKVPNAALRFRPSEAGAAGGRGGSGGGTPGGMGGARRSFAWVLDRFAPAAYAQGAPDSASRGARGHRAGRGGGGHAPPEVSGATQSGKAPSPGGAPEAGGRPWAKGLTAGRSFGGNGGAGGKPGPSGGSGYKPGQVYVLKEGKLTPVRVLTGITDGSMTEVKADGLKDGDLVVIGAEVPAGNRGTSLQPPPGMGGPQFRGPGGRR
jgi:HlyD family secretion protein